MYNLIKKLFCIYGFYHCSSPRIDQWKALIFLNSFHKCIGNPNGYIKICQDAFELFGMDKIEDIGMIYAQHGHVCTPSESSLVDGLCSLIKDLYKRYRTASKTT